MPQALSFKEELTPRYVPASDVFTKVYFTRHTNRLKSLVAAAIGIKEEEIESFELEPTELAPNTLEGKFCRLDLNVKVDGRIIDIEVQRSIEGGSYKKRSLYYLSRLYANSLAQGQSYEELPDTIIITILDENLFTSAEYRSEFAMTEQQRAEILTSGFCMVFYELRKLDTLTDADPLLAFWLRLLAARSTEELDTLAKEGDTDMAQIVDEVKGTLSDAAYRELENQRFYQKVNERVGMSEAYARGKAEGKAEGKVEGLEAGRAEGKVEGLEAGRAEAQTELICALRQSGMSPTDISAISGILLDTVQELCK